MRRFLFVLLSLFLVCISYPSAADPLSTVKQSRVYFFDNVTPGSKVSLFDESSGLEIPLTGVGVEYRDGGAEVFTPQLPGGKFKLLLGDRSEFITIEGESVAYSPSDSNSNVVWIVPFALLMVFCLFLLKFRRNRYTVVSVFFLLGVGFVGFLSVTSADKVSLSFEDVVACSKTKTASECVVPKVAEVERLLGPGAVEDALRPISSDCHSIAHDIGFESFRVDKDLEKARERASGVCAFGVVHGTVEAIATFSSDKEMVSNSEKYCYSLSNELQFACLHAIGHSTVWRVNGDLYRAMDLCSDLINHNKYECMGSAIMEWSSRLALFELSELEPNVIPVPSEPLRICIDGPKDEYYRWGCYVAMADLHHNKLDEIVDWCADVEIEYGRHCFESVANTYNYYLPQGVREEKHTVENFLAFRERVCDRGNSIERLACSEELARSIVNVNRDDKPREMCRLYPVDLVNACVKAVNEGMAVIVETGQ